ncbi:MAG: glycerol-1-phosphate dehydrogenase [NAD(P)+] [Myxococcota bacterium]|jgi:glycerol-1-phosphate dehydrogenase [NAD(P)+]
MTTKTQSTIPSPDDSLRQLLGKTIACECGRDHVVTTQFAVVERGAIQNLGESTRRAGLGSNVALLADPETFAAAGADARASLEAAGFNVDLIMLSHHPVAGPETIAQTREALKPGQQLVALGAGTVNDIAKSTAHALGQPYVVAGTALSMNGYTSAISALLEGGVKRTVPAAPPVAVVLDLDICASAPLVMTRAGLGDMLSKPFSEADWRLATGLDGGYYCDRPGSMLTDAFDRMCAAAAGIGRGDADALAPLAEAILLSGVAMAMAGQSSPASGGEHLISHYWDMGRYAVDEHPFALHGAQVGVACCVIEPLHLRAFSAGRKPFDVDALLSRWPTSAVQNEAAIRTRHLSLPASVVDGIVEQAQQKWRPPNEQRARLERMRIVLPNVVEHCSQALLAPDTVRQALLAANAPTVPSQIAPHLDGSIDDWTHVRDMRSRYTVLDLAAELDLLNPLEG